MAPWLGGGGRVILGVLPCFILLHICENDDLGPLWFVADEETPVGKRHATLCPRVRAEAGAEDLVRLCESGDLIPFGAHGRVAGFGS